MTRIITNDYNKPYQLPSTATTIGAVAAGTLVSNSIPNLNMRFLSPAIMRKAQYYSKNIDTKTLQENIESAFEKSGLKQKGVELLNVREIEKSKEIPVENQKLADSINKQFDRFIPKKFRKNREIQKKLAQFKRNLQITIEKGKNAAYFDVTNKLAVNIEKLGTSTFHEIGHALNANNSRFWKIVQKSRPIALLGGVFTATALLKRKKVENETPKNNFDKATTFIKNNVGKLTTLCFVPMIAEELMASHRGEKLAKQVLSKDMLKKVKFTNRLGASTYIALAGFAGLGAWAGSKVRDKIAKAKEL